MNNSFNKHSTHHKKYQQQLNRIVQDYVQMQQITVADVVTLWQKLNALPVPALVITKIELFWNRLLFFRDFECLSFFCQQFEEFIEVKKQQFSSSQLAHAQKQCLAFKLVCGKG